MHLSHFIDSHCHLFNAGDIPLHQAIDDIRNRLDKTLNHPLLYFAGPLAIPLLPGLLFKLQNMVNSDKLSPFIKYFENEIGQNIRYLRSEINEALTDNGISVATADSQADCTIATPLVMDFDCNGKVNKHQFQIKRLQAAAKKCQAMKILPFVGLDPRKLIGRHHETIFSADKIEEQLSTFFEQYRLVSPLNEDPAAIAPGSTIGVKLYPPLGWHINPADPARQAAKIKIYQALQNRQIPITVHCQTDSFELAINKETSQSYTNPAHWFALLDNPANNLEQLRINFAHFGGEKGVTDMVKFTFVDPSSYEDEFKADDFRDQGWSWHIVKMLKRFPNTFADLSAFDWRDEKAVAAFLWILAWDEEGKFNHLGGKRLLDKLLWGSDLPMVLGDYLDYDDYFSAFCKAVGRRKKGKKYHAPSRSQRPDKEEIIAKMVCENPKRFLFGG